MKKLTILVMAAILCCMTACDKNKDKNEPSTPEFVEAIDLGLSVKWANVNVGATKPEEYGDYFAWGETSPKSDYSWSTYKYCKGDDTMTKYCTESSYGMVDNKTLLELTDDAAHVNWGGNWRMPTYDELNELKTQCTWTWTTQNGVKGYIVKSKKAGNSNSIFLSGVGKYYWSSSLDTYYGSCYAFYLRFDSYGPDCNGKIYRCYEGLIRPVCP